MLHDLDRESHRLSFRYRVTVTGGVLGYFLTRADAEAFRDITLARAGASWSPSVEERNCVGRWA